MGKRKGDDELVRFVWKRNVNYDIMLLSEVQAKNPFVFKNAKRVWDGIARELQNGSLNMKVTQRSCRERINELLKMHRANERRSNAATGVAAKEMTEMEKLLTSVTKLQEGGFDEEVHAVYARNDKSEADAIRAAAILAVQDFDNSEEDSSGDTITVTTNGDDPMINVTYEATDFIDEDYQFIVVHSDDESTLNDEVNVNEEPNGNDESTFKDINIPPTSEENFVDQIAVVDSVVQGINASSSSARGANPTGRGSSSTNSNVRGTNSGADAADRGSSSTNLNFGGTSSVRGANPAGRGNSSMNSNVQVTSSVRGRGKNSTNSSVRMIGDTRHLNKFFNDEEESNPKQDLVRYLEKKSINELGLRKEELEFRKDELKIRQKETENKSKELEIALEKTKGDSENQKRMMDLLMQIINRN